MTWPQRIPPDLAQRVGTVLGYVARPTEQDIWGEVRDWLVKHDVEPPADLPIDDQSKTRHEL